MKDRAFFSFGGGVQSTAIALLLIHSPDKLLEVGMEIPKTIIFADTGAEPLAVEKHVEKILGMLSDAGYDTAIVRHVNAEGESIPIHQTTKGLSSVPWFTRNEKGIGMLKRQCTNEFKIQPIQKFIRTTLGYGKGQRVPARSVDLWIGISVDESRRMTINREKWITNCYPLIAIGWDRNDCAIFGQYHLGYKIPKSACFFCPYTHRQEWMRRKQEDPQEFARAVQLDTQIRNMPQFGNIQNPIYVHSSGLPLDRAVIDQLSLDLGIDYGFGKECEGHCGV